MKIYQLQKQIQLKNLYDQFDDPSSTKPENAYWFQVTVDGNNWRFKKERKNDPELKFHRVAD